MRGSEWPLIVFTILIQTCAGIFVVLSIVYNPLFIKNSSLISKETTEKFWLIITPLFLIALSVSFFHLGNPKNFIYVLSNVSSSWLSREILLTVIFAAFSCIISFMLQKDFLSANTIQLLLITCSIIGLLLVFTMSKLYMLETVPAWKLLTTPGLFYLTTFILGTFSFLFLLTFLSGKYGKNIFTEDGISPVAQALFISLLCMVLLEMIFWFIQLKVLSAGNTAAQNSFHNITNGHNLLFILRIILGLLVLISLVYIIFAFGKENQVSWPVYISFVLVILWEVIGRYLFYSMYTRVGV